MAGLRWTRGSRPEWHQGEFSFRARSRRLDRLFRRIIVGSTLLAILGLILGTPIGRRSAGRIRFHAVSAWNRLLGLPEDRSEFEANRDRDRLHGVEVVRSLLGEVEEKATPEMREFLRVVGMDRNSAVVRWGNVDWALALSSEVFEPDDSGRSYRLRPNTRSVWLIDLMIRNVSALFEIPDTPEARRLGELVGGRVVPESVQTTNSWGCRGPEFDRGAAIRGIVLGDSMMQGLLVGDDQTPTARLEVALRGRMGRSVSILNTGHLGYSPEQYYFTMVDYFDRVRPHFVVISICGNDFGDRKVEANWVEGEYWLDRIVQYCKSREVAFLLVPLPEEDRLLGHRDESDYTGRISQIYDGSGLSYLDPIEGFATEHLRTKAPFIRDGKPFAHSLLFNRHYHDNHLSPVGCDLWGRLVAERLQLTWAVQDRSGLPIDPYRSRP